MRSDEERYESIEMIIKARKDGKEWHDIIFDLITAECEGDPESEENTCTCGLESMGGSSGTLDQCYRHIGIADDLVGPVNKDDLMLVLSHLDLKHLTEEVKEAAKRLSNECTWWDDIKASYEDEEE